MTHNQFPVTGPSIYRLNYMNFERQNFVKFHNFVLVSFERINDGLFLALKRTTMDHSKPGFQQMAKDRNISDLQASGIDYTVCHIIQPVI